MSKEVGLSFILWHLNADFIWQLLRTSLFASNIIWQHNLDLETQTTLWENDVLDGMINVVILWLTGRDQITSFVFLDLGSLLSEFTRDDNFTSLDVLDLHDISDDEHGSRSDWGLLHDLGLEKLTLGIGRESLVENEIKLKDYISSWEPVSLGQQLLILIGFLTIVSNGRLSVNNLDDNGEVLLGLFDDKTRVA